MKTSRLYVGVLLLLAGVSVGIWATARPDTDSQKSNDSEMNDWHHFVVTIEGMPHDVSVWIPSQDIPLTITKGYFDLSTPVAAMVTRKLVSRSVSTPADVEKIFEVHDYSPEALSEEREKLTESEWEEVKAQFDKMKKPELNPVEYRVLGVLEVQLSDGQVVWEVRSRQKYLYDGKESFAVGVVQLVKREAGWKVMTDSSKEYGAWEPYQWVLLKASREVLLECRKSAGVEPYKDLLGTDK